MLLRIAHASTLVDGAAPMKIAVIQALIAPPASTATSAVAKLGCLASAIFPPCGVAARQIRSI
jgi:hypothetical protein